VQSDIEIAGVRWIDAGSVGLPRDTPSSGWVLVGDGVELRRTPLDLTAAFAALREVGRPGAERWIDRLEGREPDLVPVGRVGKPHGLDGSFVVEAASEHDERFAPGAVLYVEGSAATVAAAKRAGGRPVIRLDRRVERGATMAVPRESLPVLGEDEYYAFELVGLAVHEVGGRVLGRVRDVLDYPANDVLELDSGLHLPLVEACVREVDLEGGRIVVGPGFADPE
jgi:16S rRNA processing protein RimM